jgi:hypothetical protein
MAGLLNEGFGGADDGSPDAEAQDDDSGVGEDDIPVEAIVLGIRFGHLGDSDLGFVLLAVTAGSEHVTYQASKRG